MPDHATHLYSTLEPMDPIWCGACVPDERLGFEVELTLNELDPEHRCEVCGRRDGRCEEVKP